MVSMGRGIRGAGRWWLAVASGAVVLGSFLVAQGPTAGAAPVAPVPGAGQPSPFQGYGQTSRSTHSPSNSLDWAGFADTGPLVTNVTGSWTEPTVTCPATKLEQSAFWVGIDGFASTDPTVEQVGTDADCTKKVKKVLSAPSYYAWFEMYPAPLVLLGPSYPVTHGDALSASVTAEGADYLLSITDSTEHWTYNTTQVAPTPLPEDTSAEWITEAPTTCKAGKCKPLPLADFGSVAFTGATVNGLPVNGTGLTSSQITMTKNKKGTIVKASTSPLDTSGEAFTVTWVEN